MPAKRTAAGYERERERSAKTQAEKSRAGRDIADDFPVIVDPDRRARARESLELFCRTYFPEVFSLAWSNDHRRAIERIEQAVKHGGLFAYAMPRGSGKTSLAEAAVLWATLYGRRQYPFVIGSDQDAAADILESVKSEIENNDLLLDDFPEACYPIRRLEGIAHRANGQLCNGERTHIGWTADVVVLPTIPQSASSAAVIQVKGITGGIRGKKFKRPDGRSVRPDLVIIDDPQTDESAKSPSQCAERVRILSGAVLGLAGPGKKIAGVMPCTVISPGDMADVLLDREKHPEWQGERTKLVYSFPDSLDLWEQYRKVRADGLRAGDGGLAGTEFYRANREAMDRGSAVAWPVRHNHDELSAIQHAMNLRHDLGDAAFFAEYQNDPIPADEGDNEALTPTAIAEKAVGLDRGVVPLPCTRLTAFVDVQKEALFWAVCAWEDDFTGAVVDYGAYPDQRRDYFQLRDARKTLGQLVKGAGMEAAIRRGLDDVAALLLSRRWRREDGHELSVDRCLTDANWGDSRDTVYKWARETPHAAIVTPSHGKYVGAASNPFGEYRAKPGDRVGTNWRMPASKGRGTTRYALYDTNFWKSFLHTRLAVPVGGTGGLTLFGDAEDHRLMADHLTAEVGIRTEGRGRSITEWKIKPSRPDNHWFDCLAGCCVAAAVQGVSLAETAAAPVKRIERIKLSELQKNRRVLRPNRR
jgi:hypothetical protein